MLAKLFGCLDVAEPNHQVPTKPRVLPDFPYSSSSPLFDLKKDLNTKTKVVMIKSIRTNPHLFES